jgi:Secretion system C-terminal sorting domain
LPVSFSSSDPTIASIIGNTLSILKAGTVNIIASQSGNTNFNAATDVVQSLTINKVNQVITFNALAAKTFGDPAFILSATSTSGLPVTFGSSDATAASISGSTLTILKAGSVDITARQAGNDNFNAATEIIQLLTINKANQTINFPSISDKPLSETPFTLTATSTSGLPVSFKTSSTKITIAGNQVTIISAGKVSITAQQAGNSNYNEAAEVEKEFCIKPAKPNVTTSVIAGSTTLTSDAASGNQWFLNNAAIDRAINTTFVVIANGTYKVQVTIEKCVSDFSNEIPIVITGDLPVLSLTIAAYPNPADDRLIITGLEEQTKECGIVDVTGRTTQVSLTKQSEGHEADVKNLSSGMYLVRVQQSNGIQQIRFVKK